MGRPLIPTLLLALAMLGGSSAAEGTTSVSKRYVHAFDGQPFYLDAELDLGLLCDDLGLGRGIGGVCFDVPADAELAFLEGSSMAWGVPAAVLWWVDGDGTRLRTDTSCLFDDHAIPEGAARLMVIAFRPAEWNGCSPPSGILAGQPGPTGEASIIATFRPPY